MIRPARSQRRRVSTLTPLRFCRLNTIPATKRVYVATAHGIATALTNAEDTTTQAAIADVARQRADMFKAAARARPDTTGVSQGGQLRPTEPQGLWHMRLGVSHDEDT